MTAEKSVHKDFTASLEVLDCGTPFRWSHTPGTRSGRGVPFSQRYFPKGQVLMPRYTKFYSQAKVGTKMANGKIYVDYKLPMSSAGFLPPTARCHHASARS